MWSNFPYCSSGTFSLEGQYLNESSPRRVTDTFGERMIQNHSFDIQIFYRKFIKLFCELMGGLKAEISALSRNLLVLFCEKLNSFLAISALLFLSGDGALCRLKSLLGYSQVLRIFNYFTRRECRKVFNTKIDSDIVAGSRNERTFVLFNRKNHVPSVGFPLDRTGFDFPFDRTGKKQSAGPNLRQVKTAAVQFVSFLRIGERIITILSLESRIPRCFALKASLEKSIEGARHAAQNILKDLCISSTNVGAYYANFRQLPALSVIIYRPVACFVGLIAFFNGCIVKLAASIERVLELVCQSLRRAQFIFVGFHVSPFYTNSLQDARED